MQQQKRKLIIAIDGYSSCGKSTFAKAIAKELNYTYIDSGAMYRAVTYYSLKKGLINGDKIDIQQLQDQIDKINIRFVFNEEWSRYETYLSGINIEDDIRDIEVSEHVSYISKVKKVREKMVQIQREMGKNKKIVMDGRDIGTVVFPDADIKIFMTAAADIRGERRYKELIEKGLDVRFDEVMANISQRDTIDENRKESPLRKAADAIVLDNSHMTPDEQLVWFRDFFKEKLRNED